MSELTTAGDIFVPVQHGICLPRRRRVFAGRARRFMFFEFGSNGEERDHESEMLRRQRREPRDVYRGGARI